MRRNIVFPAIAMLLFYCSSIFCQINQNNIPFTFAADTSKINQLVATGTKDYLKGNFDSATLLALSAQTYSIKIKYIKGLTLSLLLQGRISYRKGDYDSSVSILKRALRLAMDQNDSLLQSSALLYLGNANMGMDNSILAGEYFFKGLEIEEKLQTQPNLQGFFNGIAGALTNQKNYPKAIEYALMAKKIGEKNNDKATIRVIGTNLGWIYDLLGKSDSASYFLNQSLKMAEDADDKLIIASCLNNLANLNLRLNKYDQAYYYGNRSYEISKAQGYKDQMVVSLISLGTIRLKQEKYKEAERYLFQGLTLSEEINAKDLIKEISLTLAMLFDKKKDYKKAYEYYKLFSVTKDSLLNQENSKLITEMSTKYATEKKEKEIELLKKNEDIQKLELIKKKNELDRQRTISIGIFVGFLLLMLVAILIFSRYRLKKKANDQLQGAFNLIEEKNAVIEKSNLMITDSITYAKRIQDAILPAAEDLIRLFPEDFFIFYQPAQIVSGDFYWCSSQNNKIIFIVADCTGHGVPGAFMSMIGNTLLNEIVNEQKITDTQKIAELLDEKIIQALHQHSDSGQYDGMDISICCIDKANNQISFTGAHHAMYAYNKELQKIKGDPYSIGGAQHQHSKIFTSQRIKYEKGLSLYFLTDGYCDQSGGEANKRFLSKNFELLLQEVQELTMNDQKEKLEDTFENWKGDTKQRDDVLIVGIKC